MCGPNKKEVTGPSWDGAHPLTQCFWGAMGSPLALGPRIASPLHAGSRAKCEQHGASMRVHMGECGW